MAQYDIYNSYNLERFEPQARTATSAARKIAPKRQEKPQLELVKRKKPSSRQTREEALEAARKTRKIFIIAALVFTFFAMVIYSRVQLDEINREISAVEQKIELVQSDTVKLNNQINSVVSIDKVEDYATNNLGMVKVQDYQVVYIDLSSDDSVVVADGKKVDTVINETNK